MDSTIIKHFASKYISIQFVVLMFILSLFFMSCEEKKISSAQQRDYLTPEIMCGTVQFTDGCSPKLDTLIGFGIALIHHMTYEDAGHTFSKVIEMDPDCFWGYWGKAMTYVHPLWPDIPDKNLLNDGFVLSQNALKLAKTPREKLYGAAIAAYYEDGLNKTEPERLIAFNNGWQLTKKELPDDIEARMFSVLSMLAVASPYDKTFKVQREAGAICEKVLETFPDNPGATHYAIHAYDVPLLAPQALKVASNYYKIAPEIPHALHMPSHIFTRLGYWQESIDLNLRSAKVAKKLPVNGQISAQYFHALDYAVYAYLQQSEFNKAKDIAVLLDSLSGAFEPSPTTAYSLAAIPGRITLELQNWTDAANLSLNTHSNFPWNKFPQYEALIYFAKGIGAGRSGNSEIALQSFQKLEELQNSFEKTDANKYWIDQIEIQKQVVKAWRLFAQNEMEKSLETMVIAAKLEDATEKNPVTPGTLLPAREMLGDLYLEMNRPKDALKQYELSLKSSPNRLNTLYGAGRSAELLGDIEKAKFYFGALLKNNKSSEPNSKRLAHSLDVVNNKI